MVSTCTTNVPLRALRAFIHCSLSPMSNSPLTLFQLTNAALSFLQSPEFAPEDRRPWNHTWQRFSLGIRAMWFFAVDGLLHSWRYFWLERCFASPPILPLRLPGRMGGEVKHHGPMASLFCVALMHSPSPLRHNCPDKILLSCTSTTLIGSPGAQHRVLLWNSIICVGDDFSFRRPEYS